MRKAERLGYKALCLTVDAPITGRRERDLRSGAWEVRSGVFGATPFIRWRYAYVTCMYMSTKENVYIYILFSFHFFCSVWSFVGLCLQL